MLGFAVRGVAVRRIPGSRVARRDVLSLLAARGVERLGRTLADGSAVLTAELALSAPQAATERTRSERVAAVGEGSSGTTAEAVRLVKTPLTVRNASRDVSRT